jgi:hypothetical protein
VIEEFAAHICHTVYQEGQNNEKELSGDAKAQLSGVISKLVDLNGGVAARLNDQKYQGVLQQQLASALKESADCQKDVFHTLVDRMLPPAAAAASPPTPGPAPYAVQTKSVALPKVTQRIYVFTSTGRSADQDVADDLAAALKDEGYQILTNAQGAALSMDITDTTISDTSRTVDVRQGSDEHQSDVGRERIATFNQMMCARRRALL